MNPELWGFKLRRNSARSTWFAAYFSHLPPERNVSYSKSSLADTLNLEADSKAECWPHPELFFRFACS